MYVYIVYTHTYIHTHKYTHTHTHTHTHPKDCIYMQRERVFVSPGKSLIKGSSKWLSNFLLKKKIHTSKKSDNAPNQSILYLP